MFGIIVIVGKQQKWRTMSYHSKTISTKKETIQT